MTDKAYPYDPDFPYVVLNVFSDEGIARFRYESDAADFAEEDRTMYVIDTTPKPRVPEGAKYIAWPKHGTEFIARRVNEVEWDMNGAIYESLEDLPGVTPETTFTVLEERKS